MRKMIAGLMLMFGSVTTGVAGGLDIALSNDTAYLSFFLSPDKMSNVGGGTEISIGAFTNEIGDDLFHATLLARGARETAGGQFYKVAAGLKLIGGDLDVGESVSALGLGFQASLVLAPSRYNPLDFIVEGFFAPSISSFNDADEYSELGARLQIDVVPQARAFLGYRRLSFDPQNNSTVSLDRNVHIGLSISF